MLEVYYNISKKLTMFTKSCRDAEEEYPPKFLKVLGEGSNWGKHAHIFTTISWKIIQARQQTSRKTPCQLQQHI